MLVFPALPAQVVRSPHFPPLQATGGSDGAIKLWQRHQWTRPTSAAVGDEVVIGSAEESGSHIAFSLPTCLPPRDTVPASSGK